MTTTETVADVLTDERKRASGLMGDIYTTTEVLAVLDRIESALASAEPVAYQSRFKGDGHPWREISKEGYESPCPLEFERRALYAHAQPAAKVEALGMDSSIDSPHFNAVAWFDTFNAYVYFDRDEAQRAHDGGNTVLPIESMAAPTPASAPDAVLEVSRRLIRDAIPATASGQTCFVPKYVIAQLADAIGFFTTPEPTP